MGSAGRRASQLKSALVLPPEIVNRVRDEIAANTGPRLRTYTEAVEAMLNRQNARGQLGSGNTVREFMRLAEDELAIRAGIVWNSIARAYAAMVRIVNDQTLGDLRIQIADCLQVETATVRGATLGRVQQLRLDVAHVEEAIRRKAAELMASIDIEARYFLDELNSRKAQSSSGTTINIGRDVQLLQTGSYAHGTVSIRQEDSQRLIESLRQLLSELEQNREIATEAREHGREIATELIQAAVANKPNVAKIRGLFSGLAQTIQTVASLGPAWRQVKDVAAAIGLWFAAS